MRVIDCHSHYEPEILDSSGILARMKNYNIDMTALMSKVTTRPIYKKSEFLMMAHRNILKNKFLRPFAKKLDDSFHKNKNEWNPWYRSFLSSKKNYKILIDPDNKSVFETVNKYPNKFYGWIFLNPLIEGYENDFFKYKQNIRSVGIKIHPFWHRYEIKKTANIIKYCNEYNLPLMIHLGFEPLKNVENLIVNNQNLKIIFCHAGFPYYYDLWPIIKNSNNLFIDLSSHHVSKSIISKAVKFLTPHKCLYGVDDPYGDDFAGQKFQQWIQSIDISYSEKELILSKNFLEIIKK